MSRKITSYTILRKTDDIQLAAEVRDCIKRGWQPYGNMVVVYESVPCGVRIYFCQPMVKYEVPTETKHGYPEK